MKVYPLVVSSLVLTMIACGGGGDGGKNAANGGAGGSASSSAGMAGTMISGGGASAGQSAGAGSSGVGGGAVAGGHCTPGTPQPSINFFGGTIDKCSSVSGLMGDYNHLLDIKLPQPIGPGETFAFSVDMGAPEGDFEVYGTTRQCGDVGEKLSTVHVLGDGIICHAVTPVTGTYSHLIWVWRVAAEMKYMAMCPAGTCPK